MTRLLDPPTAALDSFAEPPAGRRLADPRRDGGRPLPRADSRGTARPAGRWAGGRGSPPAILLGGGANALSVARNLGRLGVAVHALNEPGAFVRHSRYCRWLDVPANASAWADFLLGDASEGLRGAVLLACGDDGLELIARHREGLGRRFLLDESNPRAQLAMLDKLETYRLAVAAGVPTPGFWVVDSGRQVADLGGELTFPLIVKPRLSHVYEAQSGKKLIVAHDRAGAAAAVDAIAATGADCLLMEMVPGPDDRLCSYYTYLDADSRPLFHFTKRIIRRYPLLRGTACYHVTDWVPEAMELGNRLFRHAGLRGLANVEFKRDARDGRLKLIECNARFTASDCLVTRGGFNLAAFVYCRLTGRPAPRMESRPAGLRLWDPVRDFQAFLQLRREGQSSLRAWLASVMHRQSFPYFDWSDPRPALARLTLPIRKRLGLARR